MAQARDEFPAAVKKTLAQRVGYQCSFPGCDAPTAGPSRESKEATANTGTACHIAAAAAGPGARRNDQKMAKAERTAYENGIWMCRTHGELIDRDEVRFTIPLLIQWRKLAERRAEIKQAMHRFDPASFDLFNHQVVVTRDNLSEAFIGNAFIDAGVPLIWSAQIADAVRDFVFEITQNALTHGGATQAQLVIAHKTIQLNDNGAAFDPANLPEATDRCGGAMAVEALRGVLGDQLVTLFHARSGDNTYLVQYLRTKSDFIDDMPCHLDFQYEMNMQEIVEEHHFKKVENCQNVYILLPESISYSRAMSIRSSNLAGAFAGRQVIFVGEKISDGVKKLLAQVVGSRFLALRDD